jgi:hypothetical protein
MGMVLVQLENGGIAAALDHFQHYPGVADRKIAAVAVLVIGKKPQEPRVIGLTHRVHFRKIKLEGLFLRPL